MQNKTVGFINIDNIRIKLSNIKEYGIKEYSNNPTDLLMQKPTGLLNALVLHVLTSKDKHEVAPTKYYLFIKTYQNDNHEFSKDKQEIDAIIKKLDDHLSI